jgi:hypothetical protein
MQRAGPVATIELPDAMVSIASIQSVSSTILLAVLIATSM